MSIEDSKLVMALERTCALLAESDEALWAADSPRTVKGRLERVVRRARAGRRWDRDAVRLEYAPTNSLQDIAMENGWHDEYMEIAATVDSHCGP